MRLDISNQCLTCDYCRSVHYPEPNPDGVCVLAGRAGTACPSCRAELATAALAGQHILYCEDCRGAWIRMRIFAPLVGMLRAGRGSFPVPPRPLDARAFDRRLRCPCCGGDLDTHPYGGPGNVVIDTCEACGMVWVDRGELARIAAAPDRSYGPVVG
jgi:Zn-finger nucleic acid-binding protein